jgi:branched-chain amino acid transport system substrate-binding protein
MQSQRIPTIALGPVSAFKDGKNKYAFTCVAIPELYGAAAIDYLAAQGVKKLAVAYTGKDPYGVNGNKATVDAAKQAGIDVVLDKEIDVAGTDFTPVISQVKAAKPDAFMVWVAGPASVIITKQFAGSGIPLVMTGAEASNLYVQPAGAAAEGVTMTSSIAVPGRELPAGPLKDAVDAFANPWLKANGGVYPPQFAFDGATAIQLLVGAIEKAKSADRDKVRDALESLDMLTPTGRFTFSATDHGGIGKDAIAIVQVKGGELKATPYSLEQFKTNLPD